MKSFSAGKVIKFIGDAGLTLFANCVTLITMQMIIFPYLSAKLTEEEFGGIIFWYTAFGFVASVVGSSLSNLRLRKEGEKSRGAYQTVLLGGTILGVIIFSIFYVVYSRSWSGLIYICLILFISSIRNYYIVSFRIELKFAKVLVNSIIMAIGNFIGLLLYVKGWSWCWILLLGECASLLYILKTTSLWKEKIIFDNINITIKEYSIFIILTLSAQLVLYADRFVMKFMLGNASLTEYYIASNGTKILSVCVSATSSVILSYLARTSRNFISKIKNMMIVIGLAILCGAIGVNYICSEIYVKILYNDYWQAVQPYILSVSAVSAINMLVILIKPFVVKFVPNREMLTLELFSMILQVGMTIAGARVYGIFGVIVARGICFALTGLTIFYLLKKEIIKKDVA